MAEINLAKTQKKQLKIQQIQNSPTLAAKKRFGQNFLVNVSVQKKVIQSFQKLQREFAHLQAVLEIGPGQGHLTEYLLIDSYQKNLDFKAVEIDPESIAFLQNKFDQTFWSNLSALEGIPTKKVNSKSILNLSEKPNLAEKIIERSNFESQILGSNSQLPTSTTENNLKLNQPSSSLKKDWLVLADALELTNQQKLPLDAFVLFASLPYNVGSRILVEMAVNYPFCPFCVIIQKEVATKVDQSSNFTLFGAFLSLFYQFERAFDIAGGSFQPVPKVTSSLLLGRPKFGSADFTSGTTEKIPENWSNQTVNSNDGKSSFSTNLDNLAKNLDQSTHINSSNQIKTHNLNLAEQNPLKKSETQNSDNPISETNSVNPKLILSKVENRQKILQILKSLFGMPSKTLANNLQSLDWNKPKIDQFITQNNYQNLRLTWHNYERILWQIWTWLG